MKKNSKTAQDIQDEIFKKMSFKRKMKIAAILMEPACKLRKMGFSDEEIRSILNLK